MREITGEAQADPQDIGGGINMKVIDDVVVNVVLTFSTDGRA